MGRLLSWLGCRFVGKDMPANIIEYMSPIRTKKNGESPLTRDKAQVKAHEQDKYYPRKFSYGFYYSMFNNLLHLKRKASPNIPMLIISGAKDPVSMNAILAKDLYNTYKKMGIKNITIKLYPKDRHELLNELNYKQVQSDVLKFFIRSIR